MIAFQLKRNFFALIGILALVLAGCSTSIPVLSQNPGIELPSEGAYLIGPGDRLSVFVWRNPEVSVVVTVGPDGKVSTPLVENMEAAGKTTTQLARDIEAVLGKYIKSPSVTIIVEEFSGGLDQQVKVVGEAVEPKFLAYRKNMTLLDVMIAVGGLTEFADGDNARLVRTVGTVGRKEITYKIYLDRLINDGDMTANAAVLPGDVIVIPESWY